jgi:hypothetical protein
MGAVHQRIWWILVTLAVVAGLFGVIDVLGGVMADPGIPQGLTGLTPTELESESAMGYRLIDFQARTQGVVLIVFGVLLTAILVIPYRAATRWAWYAAWTLPAWALSVFFLNLVYGLAPGASPPPPMVSGPIFATVCAVVLIVDRRRFFGNRGSGIVRPAQEVASWTGG